MGKSKTRKMQSLLLTFILMVAALWVSPAAVAADKKMVTDPTTGKEVSAPEYGGTLTWAAASHAPNTDPWHVGGWAPHFISGVNEALAFTDWQHPGIYLTSHSGSDRTRPLEGIWLKAGQCPTIQR